MPTMDCIDPYTFHWCLNDAEQDVIIEWLRDHEVPFQMVRTIRYDAEHGQIVVSRLVRDVDGRFLIDECREPVEEEVRITPHRAFPWPVMKMRMRGWRARDGLQPFSG